MAGELENPNWVKEYTFTEEFTKDLSPAGLDKLLEEMADNPDLLRKVGTYYRKKCYKINMNFFFY